VQVADPRRVALIAKSPRKADRRDAETPARRGLGMPELDARLGRLAEERHPAARPSLHRPPGGTHECEGKTAPDSTSGRAGFLRRL